jgi:hypothetical protein
MCRTKGINPETALEKFEAIDIGHKDLEMPEKMSRLFSELDVSSSKAQPKAQAKPQPQVQTRTAALPVAIVGRANSFS